jgi:hypothetical protein
MTLTFSLWIQPTGIANWMRLLDLGNGKGQDNFVVQRHLVSQSISIDNYEGGAKSNTVMAENIMTQNQWQLITITIENRNVRFYKNGEFFSGGTLNNNVSSVRRTSNYLVKSNWVEDAYYQGGMDEVRLAKTAFSSAWIKLSHANQKAGQTLVTLVHAQL